METPSESGRFVCGFANRWSGGCIADPPVHRGDHAAGQPEMSDTTEGLALDLVTDDSVYEYEKAHLPQGAWPPTSWYAEWVSGQDVFDVEREKCPIEMRWLVYWKAGWAPKA